MYFTLLFWILILLEVYDFVYITMATRLFADCVRFSLLKYLFEDSQSLILLTPEILAIIIFNNFSQIKHFIIWLTHTTELYNYRCDSIIKDAGTFLPCGYFSSMHTSLILTGFINYRWGGILTVPGRFSQLDSSILWE